MALDVRMMRAILELGRFYSFTISEVAGGSHSSTSVHYTGRAFDVNILNGARVSSSHPDYRQFMEDCRQLGASRVLGPPSAGHNTHIHAEWAAV